MSTNDGDGGEILPFPRVILPGSLDPGEPGTGPAEDEGPAPAGSWPRLPEVAEMRPPLHLTVPGVPEPADEEGAFVPPPPADPENPTAQEIAATAMALMTALGVAAAQGMWHRARRRQALADQARATADKTRAKTAASAEGSRAAKSTRGSGGSGGTTGSLLRSPGGEKKGSRAFSRRTGDGTSRLPAEGKDRRGPRKKRPHDRSTPEKMRRAAKAAWKARRKSKRPKSGSGKDGFKKQLRRGADPAKAAKPPKPVSKDRTGKDKPKPKGRGPQDRKLTWKAPKDGKDKGPKRWTRTEPGKDAPKRPRDSRGRKAWRTVKGGAAGAKRWTSKLKGAAESKGSTKGPRRWRRRSGAKGTWRFDFTRPRTSGTAGGREDFRAWSREQGTPPPPGFEGMRPPPASDRSVRVTVERVYEWPRPEPAALTVGRAALTAGSSPVTSHQQGARFVSTPARTTQYRDAELTIHDVIDADADMAAEITDGVSEARATADGCERLMTKLEAVHAEIIALKVPGVLAGMLLLLMEKTASVKAKAEAIAETLPAASEAISTAGANAAARHKPLADAVRDAGHVRPAERDYHNE